MNRLLTTDPKRVLHTTFGSPDKGHPMNSQTLSFSASRASLLAVATLLIAAVAPNTFAAGNDDPPSVKVRFGDLNLDTQDGLNTLYRRIQGAAHRVCLQDGGGPYAAYFFWKCYESAVADAVNKVNNTRLTAMHQNKNGHKSPS